MNQEQAWLNIARKESKWLKAEGINSVPWQSPPSDIVLGLAWNNLPTYDLFYPHRFAEISDALFKTIMEIEEIALGNP